MCQTCLAEKFCLTEKNGTQKVPGWFLEGIRMSTGNAELKTRNAWLKSPEMELKQIGT